jgi:hypothetical protein
LSGAVAGFATGAGVGAGVAAGAGAGAGAWTFGGAGGFCSSPLLQPVTAIEIVARKSRDRTIAKTFFIDLSTPFMNYLYVCTISCDRRDAGNIYDIFILSRKIYRPIYQQK